jgi:hypothetical protein
MPTKPTTNEWSTVSEGAATRLQFEKFGDVFIGTYVGEATITPPEADPFDVYQFRAALDQEGLEENELVQMSQSYELKQTMSKVSPGTLCRIEYVKDVPTSRGLNPMKSFKVQTRA